MLEIEMMEGVHTLKAFGFFGEYAHEKRPSGGARKKPPSVVTPKKNGKWRVCVDYRPLNEATKRDHFPLPFQDEILNEVAGHEKYTVCDGYSGYFQIRIAEEDQKKTTFITPWGCYAFRVMPFGMTNVPATFQRFMNHVFQAFFGKSIRVYIDDFCIYSSKALHVQKVEEGLQRLNGFGGQLNPDKCHIGEDEVILLGHKISQRGIEVDPAKAKALLELPSPKSIKEVTSFMQKVKYMARFIHLASELLHPLQKLTQQVEFAWSVDLEEYFKSIKMVLSELPTLMPPCWDFPFFVNPSVGTKSIGAILLQQDPQSSRMRPVYFTSRVTTNIEKGYSEAELMMLSLIFAVRKFRSYLLTKPFVILTFENLLPWVSSQMTMSLRISKWLMELQSYEYTFKVENSVRAQLAGILTYRLHEKVIKVPNVRPLPPPPPKVLSNAYTLFFDGAFRRATGKAGGGLVLVNPEGEVVMKEQVTLDGSTSNNEAEYDILISGLKICLAQKIRKLMVKGDALLIVKQILGIWACKNERLRAKVTSIRKLFSQFEEVQLYHIPRKENEDADLLAQQAISNQDKAHMVIAAIALKDPQYAGMESLTPVVNYILEGEFPKEFTARQRRKLIKQASTFLWLEGALYQKGKDLVCRRVPSTNEIPKILKGLHEEACGGHFSHELTLKKVLLAGYVWLSMHADVQHWCRSRHNCQVNGNKRLLYGPRQAVIANGPFEKWGIDAMGPLPRTANGKLYILVAIDYMTRWVETQSVAKVNEKTVSKFVYTHICCRFGTPLEIVSDNGPRFRRGLLTEVCEELKISHRHSTPYYPQSNGLVEKANGIIAGIIRKMVESKPKRWDNFLDGAIWAYRTTYRDATQFTPFHLVYGQEALQPIELNIPTIKLTGRHEQSNDEAWIDRLLNLVELEWKREAAYHCYEKKALQLKDKLNEGIKDKEIKEKSLVLRYNNALDNRFDAKFERRWEGPFIVKKAFTGGYYQLMDLNGKEHPRKVNGYRLKPYLSCILPAVFETKQVSKKTKKDLKLGSRFETVQIFGLWFSSDFYSSDFDLWLILVQQIFGLLVSSVWFRFLNLVWSGSVTGSVHWSGSVTGSAIQSSRSLVLQLVASVIKF
ncbi:hypothetical protein L7F22_029155 [Adiantum nelumboides]|nr:hypothetical protein [Adiantum nelumboides]